MASATASMLSGSQVTQVRSVRVTSRFAPVLPAVSRRSACTIVAQSRRADSDIQQQAIKTLALSSVVGSFLAAGNANAAAEIAQLAVNDNRFVIIATLFLPAAGWVLFNIGQPALNQFTEMNVSDKGGKNLKKRSMAVGLGLTAATMMAAQSADAATEVAQLAGGDSRFLIIAGLFLPAVGWVLFNIAGPAFNQIMGMANKDAGSKAPGKGKKR